ncbi:MAG: fimbrillin family protein [Bacteroidaceae bacterium]|nr:fimbrillin family protein [Bacteroidaceae bacterium]
MKKNILYTLMMLLAVACTEDDIDNTAGDNGVIPISIAGSYPVQAATRANDNGFVPGDAVGVFVVDYNSDGTPGEPMLKGDRASNTKFVYDGGRWSASYQLYWENSKTPADFYGYYPFDISLSSVTGYRFSVEQNQDTTANGKVGYENSDLLWSKVEKVAPTTEAVSMKYKHLMAGVTISIEKGEGFTDEEWSALEKSVIIENTITDGAVNLATGECSVGEGTPKAIKPLSYNGVWRAVVFPQDVAAGKTLLSINVDKQSYKLVKDVATNYLSGKMHNFTVTVNRKTANGDYEFVLAADDILAWIDDPELHEGLVRQYTIVNVEEAGTMQTIIDSLGINVNEILSLKVRGNINSRDFECISSMSNVTNINMRDVTIVNDADGRGAGNMHKLSISSLTNFVFPEKGLKAIDFQAFMYAGLSGSLVIPEGVETIGAEAFMWCGNLTGTLTLPSTLKRIEGGAFAFTALSGPLRLPDGIEYIDPGYYNVFQGCNFEGPLYLPESLTVIPPMGFPKMTGKIIIPQGITEITDGAFSNIGCNEVVFHDGITEIGGNAFIESNLSGELVLPQNLKYIGGHAFSATKITKVIFPESLQVMENGNYDTEGTFSNCKYLTGTLTLPRNVARIPAGCFMNCSGITGLVIPEGVDIISDKAFYGCNSIGSIICEDEEPPLVCDNAFFGVNKDNFTVEVPKGCVEKYRNAQGWSEFKRIAEYSNFVCRPAQANALNGLHTETLVLNADGDWEVEHMPDWCKLSQTSGHGKSELHLTFTELEHNAGNRRDSIVFRMPAEEYTTYCVVSQYDYEHEEDSYLTLQNHTKGAGIDIMFIGDGWTGEDISNGSYLELIKQQTEYFFGVEPYKSHREYFNVHVAFPLSQESGVNTMHTYVNNRFGTLYGYIGDKCSINRLLTESDEVIDYAFESGALKRENRWRSMIILVPNSDVYSGVTEFHNGMPLSICPPSNRPYPQDTRGVIQHEAGGHGFGRLADEEIVHSAWVTPNIVAEIEEKHREGFYKNIATTSKMSQVPWADFIFDTRYSDYVDIYEGAYSYMRGVFRSESNSCMNYGIPYYNTISRLEIMKRIFNCAGEQFTMEYFYANDTNKWGDTDGTTRAGTEYVFLNGSSYAGSNQHNEPQFVNAKEQGASVREIRDRLKE